MTKARYSLSNFTSFQGINLSFTVTRDDTPELYMLAQKFPSAVSSALKSLGWYMRQSMRETIEAGGPANERWLELSNMRRHRRMEKLKAGEIPRRSSGKKKSEMVKNWTASPERSVFGRVAQTLAYRKPKNEQKVEIGALNASAASFFEAVQGGKRGKKGKFEFVGRQVVTPKMRRAFWAAGMPLAADTKVIGQEARPLVQPIFKAMHPKIELYLVNKISERLAKQGIDWTKS